MCKMCDDNGGEMTSCQDCGKLICFDVKGHGDDVVAPAYVTSSGDVFCLRCGRGYDEEEEERNDEESEGYTMEDIYPAGAEDVNAGGSSSEAPASPI